MFILSNLKLQELVKKKELLDIERNTIEYKIQNSLIKSLDRELYNIHYLYDVWDEHLKKFHRDLVYDKELNVYSIPEEILDLINREFEIEEPLVIFSNQIISVVESKYDMEKLERIKFLLIDNNIGCITCNIDNSF